MPPLIFQSLMQSVGAACGSGDGSANVEAVHSCLGGFCQEVAMFAWCLQSWHWHRKQHTKGTLCAGRCHQDRFEGTGVCSVPQVVCALPHVEPVLH